MTASGLVPNRRELLSAELAAQGVDMRQLEFLQWLVEHDKRPEWPEPTADESQAPEDEHRPPFVALEFPLLNRPGA